MKAKTEELPSRRELLVRFGTLALSGVAACKMKSFPASCVEVAGLAPEDTSARTTLAYVEPAADKTRTCANCQQFVAPPDDGSCGSCKVLKGPVHPYGTCKVFAPRTT